MRTDRVCALAAAVFLSCASAWAQDASQDEVDPRELHRFWLETQTKIPSFAATGPYTLTAEERTKYPGSFGVDLSHYSFDNSSAGSTCTPYTGPQCSCSADWDMFASNGILYIYSKASDGSSADPSFPRFWSEMAQRHANKTLFRGAYHFLRPGIDAQTQADAFLTAIGATNGNKPPQLPPALDIEWSNKKVSSSSACPADRQTTDSRGNIYCDMWFTMSADKIVALASEWINRVSTATGRPVVIYTNPTAWWNPNMGSAGDALSQVQAIWTSRYPGGGPAYQNGWTSQGGSPGWQMPPLPHGASYPPPPPGEYTKAHFWQFSENAVVPAKPFTCQNTAVSRLLDMNWLPVDAQAYQTLFGVGQ